MNNNDNNNGIGTLNQFENMTMDNSLLNTLNGFLFVLSKNGDIIYLSENVEHYLGLNQIDLMGQSIYDYSHPCDHDDIKSLLQPSIVAFNATKQTLSSSSLDSLSIKTEPVKKDVSSSATTKSPSTSSSSSSSLLNNEILGDTIGPYFIRMKCTLTNKGRNLNLKSANYKVSHCDLFFLRFVENLIEFFFFFLILTYR